GDPALRVRRQGEVDGAVLGPHAFVLRWFSQPRLLVVNLGLDLELAAAPEPLLAPPEGTRWRVLWSSEDPRYGGGGVLPPETPQACARPTLPRGTPCHRPKTCSARRPSDWPSGAACRSPPTASSSTPASPSATPNGSCPTWPTSASPTFMPRRSCGPGPAAST